MNITTFRLLLFGFLLSIFSLSLSAQDYTTAIGIRVGSANGISFKQFVSQSAALEGLIVYRRNGFRAVGMLMGHIPLGRKTNTHLYLGGGGHYGYNNLLNYERAAFRVAGIDAILGVEFGLPRHKMSLAFDIKPMYELAGGSGFSGNNGGASLRFWLD